MEKHEIYDNLKTTEAKLKELYLGFLDVIPDYMKREFEGSFYIGGGCIYSLFNNGTFKDVDIFVTDKELLLELEAWCLENFMFKEQKGVLKGSTDEGMTVVITDNAITIGNYQIVKRDVGDPSDVVSRFDFKHNMFWFNNDRVESIVDYKYLTTNSLYLNDLRPRHMAGVLVRVSKYINRGMKISLAEMSKIALKVHEVGFEEFELDNLKRFKSFDS